MDKIIDADPRTERISRVTSLTLTYADSKQINAALDSHLRRRVTLYLYSDQVIVREPFKDRPKKSKLTRIFYDDILGARRSTKSPLEVTMWLFPRVFADSCGCASDKGNRRALSSMTFYCESLKEVRELVGSLNDAAEGRQVQVAYWETTSPRKLLVIVNPAGGPKGPQGAWARARPII